MAEQVYIKTAPVYGTSNIRIGLLYNLPGAVQAASLFPNYRLPTNTDATNLRNYVGSGIEGANKLSRNNTGLTISAWHPNYNTGTNTTGFTAMAAGTKDVWGATHIDITSVYILWCQGGYFMQINPQTGVYLNSNWARFGYSVRLMRDLTTDESQYSDGTIIGSEIGLSGDIYNIIKIGNQGWFLQNMNEISGSTQVNWGTVFSDTLPNYGVPSQYRYDTYNQLWTSQMINPGGWSPITNVWTKVSGVWKPDKIPYVKVSGVWKPCKPSIVPNLVSCGYAGKNGISTADYIPFYTIINNDTDWTDISVGFYHGLGLKNGDLYGWGGNNYGESQSTTTFPTRIGSFTDWSFIAGGRYRSFAIREGKLYGFGYAGWYQFGHNTDLPNVTQLGSATDHSYVATGMYHTLVIRSGYLYATGYNQYGYLGTGDTNYSMGFIQIGSYSDWTHVAAGYSHSLGIRAGKLYGWGRNNVGQNGTGADTYTPTQIGTYEDWTYVSSRWDVCFAIRAGKLYGWGDNSSGANGTGEQRSTPTQIGTAEDWTTCSAGSIGGSAIRDGFLYTWGSYSANSVSPQWTNASYPVQWGTSDRWIKCSMGEFLSGAIKHNNI